MDVWRTDERRSFVTLDGSQIRELAGIPSGNAIHQSLAVLMCCCAPPYSHDDTVVTTA